MNPDPQTIVLGVSGSVACYRACDLARDLMRQGFEVRACLTDSAQKFVSPALFEALTGRPCLMDSFEEPERGRMAHIDWARQASLVLVAPATANVLNKLAAGFADDMLTTIALAYEGPLVVAPAMNPAMYSHATTQESLKRLEARGVVIVEPLEGEVACGEQGQGKLASNPQIVDAALFLTRLSQSLKGKRVLITSGPTREPIDDVRFLSNRSSGKMGVALAKASLLMGADVTIVSGPTSVVLPQQATVVRVETAREMLEAAKDSVGHADIIIGAAAVSDFTVMNPVHGKLRRADGLPKIDLAPNQDIIAELACLARPGAKVVAFAAEPSPDLAVARSKLAAKRVVAIAVNDVSDPAIGFESDENEVTFVTEHAIDRSPRTNKFRVALWIMNKILDL